MGRRGRSNLGSETTFFVTTTVVKFAPVFTNDKYCDILVHNIKHYQKQYGFGILGYVIMPTHFHWIIRIDPELGTISDIMRDIKKYSAWDVLEALGRDGHTELLKLFSYEAMNLADQKRKFWMGRFDDEVIRNSGMMRTKLEYMHNNPVVAGIVANPEEYKYSSARNYLLGDHSVLHVQVPW